MELTIGIDLRCLPTDGSAGAGIAHASREIVRALIGLGEGNVIWKLFLPTGAAWDGDDVIWLPSPAGHALRVALETHSCDLLFVPSGAIPPGLRIPAIPWIHDLAMYAHPEWFSESPLRRAVTTRLFRNGVRRALRLCAASVSTQKEIVHRFGIDTAKVTVTLEGGDSVLGGLHGESLIEAKRRARQGLAERGITHAQILFLGTLEPRKNLPMLLEAWLRARTKFERPVDLLIAGRNGWKLKPIHHALRVSHGYVAGGPSRIHRIDATSDDDRRDLLLAADLVAVPSLHEGFGLVALEAMQAGTAVIASDVGALPEVLGSGGALLPPRDGRMWSEALAHVMNDEESRQHLAERGKARSQGMTWERTGKIVFDVLTR